MTRSTEAQGLSLGVLARSRKENEQRLPIHPAHFARIDPCVRSRIFLEHGYGSDFGATDDALAELVGGIAHPRTARRRLRRHPACPRCRPRTSPNCSEGQIVWGWPHCVQDSALTQIAIDRRLTLIAFEAMNHWQSDGGFSLHVFHKNNELAGYCSVLHAMQLVGITGSYGRRSARCRHRVRRHCPRRRHRVERARRRRRACADQPGGGRRRLRPSTPRRSSRWDRTRIRQSGLGRTCRTARSRWPASLPTTTSSSTASFRIPTHRWFSSPSTDLASFAPGSLIVDVSCDTGMGFSWAHPTSFTAPIVEMSKRRALLRRRPQPVLPVELGDVGDQRGVVAAPRHGADRAGGVEREPDDLASHRDSRRHHPQPRHLVVSAPRRCLSASRRGLTTVTTAPNVRPLRKIGHIFAVVSRSATPRG